MGTNTGTVMTLANSIIGVGVLAMPFCFKQCGIILSIIMLLLSSCLSRLACHFLLKAAIMARRRNFEFLAFHTFGPSGKTVVELCIIGFLMGTCIAFFVVVGDLGPVIVAKTLNINNSASLRQSVLVGLAVFVVLPLGLLRNVDSLTSICTATIGFYLCLVMKVMAEAMPHLIAADWVDKVHFWRPAGMLQCIPIFSMALFCQTQLFEIYESLPNATLDKMNDVIRAAVTLCTAFYICVGFFGYVAFCTQNFSGNVLMSFTPTLMSDVIKMGFVLSVAVSFPLVIFPCRVSLYSLLFKRNPSYLLLALDPINSQNPEVETLDCPKNKSQNELADIAETIGDKNNKTSHAGKVHLSHHESLSSHIPEARFKCLTIGIICASLIVGLLIPNIELVLGIVGSTIGVLICVMFPAVAFICISPKSSKERLFAQVLVFVGVLILVLGTYATLYAANEASDTAAVEVVSPPSEHLDSVVRMSRIQGDKSVVDGISADVEHQNVDKPESKVKLKDSVAESKQEKQPIDSDNAKKNPPQPDLQMNSVGDKKPLPVPVEPGKKPDVRKEPPVPVEPDKSDVRQEPAGDHPAPPVVPSPLPDKVGEKKEKDIVSVGQEHDAQIEETAHHESVVNKDVGSSLLEKKILPDPLVEKGKGNSEQVNQDAIKKEDEELAEAAKQAEEEDKEKKEELLRKLEMHQKEQKKLLQEQKQILQELKEQKKEIEQAAAKQRNDDPQESPQEVKEIPAVKPDDKSKILKNVDQNSVAGNDKLGISIQNAADSQNVASLVKSLEIKNEINQVKKPQSEVVPENKLEKKNPLVQHMKLGSPEKISAQISNQQVDGLKKDLNFQKSQPVNIMTQDKLKAADPDVSKLENVKPETVNRPDIQEHQDLDNNGNEKIINQKEELKTQNVPVPLPNRLALPLPLARDNASKFYKQQQDTKNETVAQINKVDTVVDSQKDTKDNVKQNNAAVDEAKVMRRDILANIKDELKTNITQEKIEVNPQKDTVDGAKQRDILSNFGSNERHNQKEEDHERQKRDTVLEEMLAVDKEALTDNDIVNEKESKPDIPYLMQGHNSENCEANEKRNKQKSEKETVNLAAVSKEKHNAINNDPKSLNRDILPVLHTIDNDSKLSNIKTVSNSILQRKPNNPAAIKEPVSESPAELEVVPKVVNSVDDKNSEKQELEGTLKTEIKMQSDSDKLKNSDDGIVNEHNIISTLSSIIKTPSHLSDPKLGDHDIHLLNEAVGKVKDISVVAKPMSRDLKSVPGTQQVHEEKDNKEEAAD